MWGIVISQGRKFDLQAIHESARAKLTGLKLSFPLFSRGKLCTAHLRLKDCLSALQMSRGKSKISSNIKELSISIVKGVNQMEDKRGYVIRRTLEGASLEDILSEIDLLNDNKELSPEEVKQIALDAKKARRQKKFAAMRTSQGVSLDQVHKEVENLNNMKSYMPVKRYFNSVPLDTNSRF